MIEPQLVDQAVRLLGTAIAMIMEDHAEGALTISAEEQSSVDRVTSLERAGRDVAVLAEALNVLLRRRDGHEPRNPGRPAEG